MELVRNGIFFSLAEREKLMGYFVKKVIEQNLIRHFMGI